MPDQIVYLESLEDAVAALRDRGLGGSEARRLVDEAVAAADGDGFGVRIRRRGPGDTYGLYAFAGTVAARAAFLTTLF